MGKRFISILGVFVLLVVTCCGVAVPQSSPILKGLNGGGIVKAATYQQRIASWDTSKSYTVTKGSFKFYAHLSKNKKKAWVYKVTTRKKKATPTSLKFPKKIKKINVTRIGADMSSIPEEDLDFYQNIFGVWVEYAHDCDGYGRSNSKIKTMTLPATVTEIEKTSFSGMRSLTKVKIPDKVKVLDAETFYGCQKLKEVKLPKNFTDFSSYTCFADCPKLDQLTISKKNKKFTVKGGLLLSKNGKKLVWVAPKKKTVTVPKHVTTIQTGAFYSSNATTVKLGKNINNLQRDCLSGTEIEKITLDKANPVYAKSGQCIYRKTDGLLVVAIAKSAELVISNKVKKISADATLCGTLTEGRDLMLLDIPASVTWLGVEWNFAISVCAGSKVYFRGTTPPQLEEGGQEEYAKLPIFCKVYVPKASLTAYQEWYKTANLFMYIDEKDWHTF
ncbi:MAG: leucine-rich repeat domain-containing protein [Lachnospiraceae bacterium]|nr:leucine-rich repeat domain-containing protein [Lachnospiraceae bacterium]